MTQHQTHKRGDYRKVFDQRKRRIRGLWQRNGAYYAQLAVPDPATGVKVVKRARLEDKDGQPVATPAEASKIMASLKVKREEDALRLDPKRTPTFGEYAQTYLKRLEELGDAKRPQTVRRERGSIHMMSPVIGHLRLRQITSAVIANLVATRKGQGLSARAVNLDLIALRNVLKAGVRDSYLSHLPETRQLRLREPKPMHRMPSPEEIERVADTAISIAPTTGQMVADFIRLMSYSGGRWGETLRLRWSDVHFDRQQLLFGTDGKSKNGETRAVDFNPALKQHLEAMSRRKAPDSEFLFPSRRRSGEKDLAMLSFNKTLREARVKAGVPDFTCHMCRHFFASMCLMSKVDVATVAAWLGHRDNGVLLAKTYSHLLGEHKAKQAQQVSFGPVVLPAAPVVDT
jgi:integrase